MPARLLVLSNGHGEDLIALRLIEALGRRRPGLAVRVLPLVGKGEAFIDAERAGLLQRLGPPAELPSGGFSNQSLAGMLADLGAGLTSLTWRQWRLVRRWGRQGEPVLAVGDLLPLLLAWQGGGPYGVVGTPKRDYPWAPPPPASSWPSPLSDGAHRCKGSEWDPWEWSLMARPRCKLVAVRDPLTARGLRRHGVAALAPGNPMMDGLTAAPPPPCLPGRRLLLLPGSRRPEGLANLERLLRALPPELGRGGPVQLLLATGGHPSPGELAPLLQRLGFSPATGAAAVPGATSHWRRERLALWQGSGAFTRWAGWAELGLACAGTATEQLTGLGCPALSLPGPGPQFTAAFARRQSRLLGGAVEPCGSGEALGRRLLELLADPQQRRRLGQRGRRRMGGAGGSERLAALIDARLLRTIDGRW
ncbi:MAG: lipid-A-disaccharide synthase-related protein [Prochlorococcaceae cyanobacterium]